MSGLLETKTEGALMDESKVKLEALLKEMNGRWRYHPHDRPRTLKGVRLRRGRNSIHSRSGCMEALGGAARRSA